MCPCKEKRFQRDRIRFGIEGGGNVHISCENCNIKINKS